MVTCWQVTLEISNLIEGGLSPQSLQEIQHHLAQCRRCSVLVDSVRKVMIVTADEQTFEVPLGYSRRMGHFIESVFNLEGGP